MEREQRRKDVPSLQTELFVERRNEVSKLLQSGFAGAPWFEEIDDVEALARVESHAMKPGFEAILLSEDDTIVAGLWYDTPSLSDLRNERGASVADFAQTHNEERGIHKIVWEREVVVDPQHQGRGLATRLRRAFLDHLAADESPVLLLTRMRDDNAAVIAVAQKFGYTRTGIRMPSSQNPEVSHEYWYVVIGDE